MLSSHGNFPFLLNFEGIPHSCTVVKKCTNSKKNKKLVRKESEKQNHKELRKTKNLYGIYGPSLSRVYIKSVLSHVHHMTKILVGLS